MSQKKCQKVAKIAKLAKSHQNGKKRPNLQCAMWRSPAKPGEAQSLVLPTYEIWDNFGSEDQGFSRLGYSPLTCSVIFKVIFTYIFSSAWTCSKREKKILASVVWFLVFAQLAAQYSQLHDYRHQFCHVSTSSLQIKTSSVPRCAAARRKTLLVLPKEEKKCCSEHNIFQWNFGWRQIK